MLLFKKQMNFKNWLILGLLLVLMGTGLVWYWRWQNKPMVNYEKISSIKQIAIEGVVFDVELAITEEQKKQGLSGKDYLCEQCGMLFVYNTPGYYSFWMKDTLIPLDIIWFDENWQVVDYLAWAQPQGARKAGELPIYQPKEKAWFVLEVPGGTTKRINNFKISSKADIR